MNDQLGAGGGQDFGTQFMGTTHIIHIPYDNKMAYLPSMQLEICDLPPFSLTFMAFSYPQKLGQKSEVRISSVSFLILGRNIVHGVIFILLTRNCLSLVCSQ